ncbi:ATP-binding protein [Jatrophihabitans sp.]|uniref:sensor histidine kinase n=1 Tax=Jatrophihabitans sp. TaxID=1932789 RepID=UPI0030C69A32|nr:integral rane sensor signal transduction histidine kinase [Jatrophihabitans sp.]
MAVTADTTAAVTAEPSWQVLTAHRTGGVRRGAGADTGTPPGARSVLLQIGAATIAVVALVAVAGSFASRHIAESESVHEVATLTDVLATSVVQPALADAMSTSTTAAHGLDGLVRSQVLSATLIRVKLWTPSGRILYSDEPRLVGRTFGLDPDGRRALTGPQTEAQVSDLDEPENQFERGDGKLLEVSRPVWTPSGQPLLFETYFRYSMVSDRAAQLWRGFSGIMISSLLAILVLLTPLVWTLLGRARRASRQREAMLRRSMDASAEECRRIAATLHDGVVQELVAASFTVGGSERAARTNGEHELAASLQAAGETLRSSIGGMRSLLVDIYPASLREAGLASALRELAGTVRGPEVTVHLDDTAVGRLGIEQQETVYRLVQEWLRNAAAHAEATAVIFTLRRDKQHLLVVVADNGIGFDPETASPEGHFGLRLVRELATRAGGELALRTAPGAGTTWQLRLEVR